MAPEIRAFLVSPGRNGADFTCYPFKAGDAAGMESAGESAKEHIAEAAENLEYGEDATIEIRVLDPDECLDCESEDDACPCRQSSRNPGFRPAWEAEGEGRPCSTEEVKGQ